MPAPRGSRGAARGARGGGLRGGRTAAAAAAAASQPADAAGPSNATTSAPEPATLIESTESSAANTPSGTPAPTSTSAAAAAAAAKSRFRPKNVRRDADERRKLEEQRSRDLAAKIKVEERELAKEERRARRGRGRGDAMSQRGTRRGGASGPFSSMPAENAKSGASGGFGWSGGRGGRGGFGASKGGHHGGHRTEEQRYRPRRDHEPRVNVEVLSGFAEDDEGQPMQYASRSNGAHPVGLFRTEHEDQIVKVATTAELEAEEQESDDDGDLFVPGDVPSNGELGGMKDDNEVWHAAPTGTSGVAVKAEPGTEGESMDVDIADIPSAPSDGTQIKPPSSPELTKKKPAAFMDPTKEKKREKALQDPEVQNQMYDMQTLLSELSFYDPDQEEASGVDKEGRLYLFQLPPVLPPLVRPEDIATEGSTSSAPINLDMRPRSQSASAGATPAASSTPKVKDDPDAGSQSPDASSQSEPPFPPEGGYIGRLVVRKSGKVALDWGGTTLDLGMATETDFLTSSIMVETKDHPEHADMVIGAAAGMGQVMGKFVLTPVWDEEDDWEPSLEGIEGVEDQDV